MIIVYDSKCDFCTHFIQFAERKKRQGKSIEFYDLRTIEARQALKKKDINFVNLNTIYLIDGSVSTKSRAVLKILNKMRLPYSVFWIFSIFPRTITDRIYDLVAKNRYKISKFLYSPPRLKVSDKD